MDKWQGVITAAKVGALIGAGTGLVPLAFGLFHKQKRKALAAFAGCVVAGVVGGLYGAIAGAGVGLGNILRTKKSAKHSPS